MTKAEILKQTGLTEEEFYKKFPTQESFEKFMKGGKLPKAAMGMLVGKAIEKGEQLQGLQAAGLTAAAGAIESATENKNEDTRMFGATASGAARGAASGAMFGPAGMGIGALIGGASGFIQGRQDLKAEALQDQRQAFTENLNEQAENIAKAQVGTDTSGYGVGQMKHGGKVYNLFGAAGPYGSSPFYAYGGMTNPEYEAEGGEILQSSNMSNLYGQGELQKNSSNAVKLDGPSHEEGGMPMSTNGEGRIFSDRLKPKGDKKNTFASLADDLTKELGKLEESEKTSSGDAAKNTLKYMKKDIEAKLDNLFNLQETQKAEKEERKAKREFKKGGWMKYNKGGEFDFSRTLTPEQLAAISQDALEEKQRQAELLKTYPERLKQIQGIPNQGFSDMSGTAYDASGDMDTDITMGNIDRRSALEAAQSVQPIVDQQQPADKIGFDLIPNENNISPLAPLNEDFPDLKAIEDLDMPLEDEVYPSNETDYYSGNTFAGPGVGVRKPLSPDMPYQAQPFLDIDDPNLSGNLLSGVLTPRDRMEIQETENTPISMDVMGAANIPSILNDAPETLEKINEPEIGSQLDQDEDGAGEEKKPGMTPEQFMIASAAPGIVNNLYRGLFGKVDQPFLGRASAMPGGTQALREAGEYTAYNPAAELAANQAAAGRARAQMGRTGNLAALMQGNIAAGRMEGQGASQVLGGAERMNVQLANQATNRKIGIRQQLMQDAKQTELFNLQQRMREQEMFDQGQAAKENLLSTGLDQMSALGRNYAASKMQAGELAKLYSKLG